MFRSLLSHVDVEGELESPTMSQGEPLPRPFLHHSHCLRIDGFQARKCTLWRPSWRSLAGLCEYLIVFLEKQIFLCAGFDPKFTVTSLNSLI